MSGYGISTHGIIDEALRISRRRFLAKVAAAGLATGVPVCTTIAQETQRPSIGEGKGVSLGEALARYAAASDTRTSRKMLYGSPSAPFSTRSVARSAATRRNRARSRSSSRATSVQGRARRSYSAASRRAPIWRFSPTA